MRLTPNEWQQLETLVDKVLATAPDERPALIEQLSGADAERRAVLTQLVAECEQGRRFLDRPVAERFAGLVADEPALAAGVMLERYRIIREEGRGGMAVVYRAHDTKHDRDVALKVVRPELSAALGRGRFLREIEIAAKLHHPHIVSLYDSGEADGALYYVMPFEEGPSLRQKLASDGKLAIAHAIAVLRDVADAMAYAHRQGVVHRDIKPENVMLSGRHALVTDFGVAKALTVASDAKALTTVGVALGTPAYMAPEQIVADPSVDNRADIYAFGAMAYELFSGEPPFVRPSAQAVLGAHMTEQAVPLSERCPMVPAPLSALVMRCLQKDPAARWQKADDLLSAIEAIAATGAQPRDHAARKVWRNAVLGTISALLAVVIVLLVLTNDRRAAPQSDAALGTPTHAQTIAVLPFENRGQPGDDYFAAGITDEITSRLGAVSGLSVVSRRAAQRFASTDVPLPRIGEALGVDYVLTGSVRWSGGGSRQVRITLELLRTRDEHQLWSTNYDRVIDDIFKVQSDIAGRVIQTLGVTLLERERKRLSAEPTANHEAYTLYLKGRYYWNKRTEENIQLALDQFQKAVDLDPGFSLAWVGIADTWISRGWYSRLAPRDAFPKAQSAALKALQFDSTLSEAHATLAHIHLEFDHDWTSAEREYKRAIELDPRNSIAHHWYGGFLSAMGRHAEALQQAESARALDPLAPIIQTWVGLRYYFARKYPDAIREHLKALELDRNFAPGHWHLGWAYEQAGRFDEAVAEAERAVALDNGSLLYLASLGHAYAMAGRPNEARAILARLMEASRQRHVSAYHVAVIHNALGDVGRGLDWLERAQAEQSPWIGYLNVDPRVDRVRSQPRFKRILAKVRLSL